MREDLQSTDELFGLMVASVVDYAIVLLDQDGRVVTWNAGAERIKGYRSEQIVGRHFSAFYPAADIAAGKPDYVLRTAASVGRVEDEGWRIRSDGTPFWANVIVTALRSNSGELRGFAKLVRDLTERRQAETALQRSEERFRRVVEAAPNAIVMVNEKGHIEMINAQAERVFGYTHSELMGQPVEMLVPVRFRSHHPGLRASFFSNPRSRPMGMGRDVYARRKDGTEFPAEIGLSPVETDEGTMVLSAIVDISTRKHEEERIHASLKEKDILLGEIHHRVKNNLQIVHSLLDMQSSGLAQGPALDRLRESQNRIKSMALIHQTLYESKDFARVDFSTFLDAFVPTLISAYGADPARIALAINAVEVLLPLNVAVPCGLIVNELISNALKHAFPDDRRGEIRVDLTSESSGRALLSVCDDGIGLPEEVELAKCETLGLQLVSLLVEQVGGEVTICRADPTRFDVSFPIQR